MCVCDRYQRGGPKRKKIDLWVERDLGSYSCIILNDGGRERCLWEEGHVCYYRDKAQLAAKKQCNAMAFVVFHTPVALL
jgi:hypothetical protein